MKIFLILVFFSITQLSAVTVTSQTFQLKIQDLTVREALREIERQSSYNFFYNDDFTDLDRKLTTPDMNTDIHGAVESILANTTLTYRIIDDKLVVITPEYVLEVNEVIEIVGRVTSSRDETLPGVSVYIKGTSIGTITDMEGRYRLRVPDEGAILVFSYVGKISVEIQVGSQRWINVKLEPVITELAEVVVTGYQTLSHERVTGSFELISSEELERAITFSIEDKLEGMASGVLLDPLGIAIRGIATLHGSRIPLLVVDGFPLQVSLPQLTYSDDVEFAALTAALESINPNDVESITVMKDAAATSIWGSRAANGVIVITTKTGRTAEPDIQFHSNFSISPKPDVSRLPFASPETYLEIERARYDAGWLTARITGMDAWFYNVSDHQIMHSHILSGKATGYELGLLEAQMGSYDNRYEFSDLFLRSSTRQQHSFSISQRVQALNYRLSISHDMRALYEKGNSDNRTVIAIVTQYEPKKWLSLNINANITLSSAEKNGFSMPTLFNIPQHQRILDANGDYTSMSNNLTTIKGRNHREEVIAENDFFPYDWEYNIKREFDNSDNTIKNSDIRLQSEILISPFKADMLTLSFKYQYERFFSDEKNMFNEETFYVRDQVNLFAQPNFLPIPKGNIFEQQFRTREAHNLRLMMTFRKLFSRDHLITFLSGVEGLEQFSDQSNNRRYGFNPQTEAWAASLDFYNRYPRNLTRNKTPWNIDSRRDWSTRDVYGSRLDRFLSYFANASYTFRDKYDITGSIRLDQSNTFGQSSKYRDVPLWSAGAGWSIDRESFFNVDFINRLRLRATYGFSGNIDKRTSPYPIAVVGGSYNNPVIGLEGALINSPANPELRWEKTEQINLAVDFSILNRLIHGSIDLYSRKSTDLLATMNRNSTYGFSRALINFGSMTNKGIDANISLRVIQRQVGWTTQIRHSYNINEIVRTDKIDFSTAHLASVLAQPAQRMVEGRPRFNIVSIPWGGLDSLGMPQFFWADSLQNPLTTNYTTAGYDFFPFLAYEGSMQAPHHGSWTNSISYKGIEFSAMLTYKFGHYYRHTGPLLMPNNDFSGMSQGFFISRYASDWDNMWRNPGDEMHTDIPRIPFELTRVQAGRVPFYALASNYGSQQIEPAALIRFSRISLSYNVPRKWLTSFGVQRMNISLQARNLGLITFNKFNEDPENLPDMYGRFLTRPGSVPEYTLGLRINL